MRTVNDPEFTGVGMSQLRTINFQTDKWIGEGREPHLQPMVLQEVKCFPYHQ